MDDKGIEKWINRVEANKAARAEKRTGREKKRKIDMKKRGVQPEQPAMIIHARRKHRQNSNFRESRGDHREYETRWDIIDDEEQFTNAPNSVTVTGDEWWVKIIA